MKSLLLCLLTPLTLASATPLTLINCINANKLGDGDAFARKIVEQWRAETTFSGFQIDGVNTVKAQSDTFFRTGRFVGLYAPIVFHSKFVSFVAYGPAQYCAVKTGDTQP